MDDVGETIEEWKLGAIAPDLFHNPAYLRRRCSHRDSVVLPAATLDAGPDNGGRGVEATTDANDRKSDEGVAGNGDEGRDEDEPGGEDDAGRDGDEGEDGAAVREGATSDSPDFLAMTASILIQRPRKRRCK